MNRFKNKKVLAIGLSVGLTLAAAGAAFAYFTSTGTGTGSAVTGSATNWGVAAGTEVGAALFPGIGTETITYTITNNGTGDQALQTVAAVVNSSSGNVTVAGVAVSGCLATWYTASAATPSPVVGTTIAPAGTATDVVTVALTNAAVNQNPCQGIHPDIVLNVT